MTSIVNWILTFIDIPPQFQFLLYVAAVSVLLILFIVTLDLFSMLILAIFKPKR